MRKIKYGLALFFVFFDVICASSALGWDDSVTHKDLTEQATKNSLLGISDGLFLNSLGFAEDVAETLIWPGQICDDETKQTDCKVIDWLKYGAEKEDAWKILTLHPSLRMLNHFHEPINGRGLYGPRLDDFNDLFGTDISPLSTLGWAQDFNSQASEPLENDQSWPTLRGLYYIALTQTDEADRKATFAQLFKGLGHQMHLVQDMATPTHVRNDAHILDPFVGKHFPLLGDSPLYFESWAKKARGTIIGMASGTAVLPTLTFDTAYADSHGGPATSPVSQLWDADVYNGTNPSTATAQGLAEYTNANFYSDDTIFAAESLDTSDPHYFPYPRQVDTNLIDIADLLPKQIVARDGNIDFSLYLSKFNPSGGVELEHFVRVGYLSSKLAQSQNQDMYIYSRSFFLDEACHQDYAAKLVPRAVGYSAALLDYFFRGDLDIQKAYFTYNDDLSLAGMGLEFKNISAPLKPGLDVEPLSNGQIDLVCRYLPPGEEIDAKANGRAPVFEYELAENIYTVTGDTDPINSEYVTAQQDILFTTPIPPKSTQITYMLVYLGTVGDEQNAVLAAGQKGKGSRIAYHTQPGGHGNPSAIETVLANGEAIVPVTGGLSRRPWYFYPTWSRDGKNIVFDKTDCATELDENGLCWYDPSDDILDYESVVVAVDLISESYFPQNVTATFHIVNAVLLDCTSSYNYINPELTLSSPSFSPEGDRFVAIATAVEELWAKALVTVNFGSGDWEYVGGCEKWAERVRWLEGGAPAWNPQDETIAFYTGTADRLNDTGWDGPLGATGGVINLIGADGSNEIQITGEGYLDTQPAWSPDGQWIAFVSNRDERDRLDIWIMDRNGNYMQKIFAGYTSCYSPSFSPEGLKIAFKMGPQIYTIDIWGENLTPIVQNGESPEWSPLLPIPSVNISADAATITAGQSVTLNWASAQGLSASIDNGIGSVELSGSTVVTLTQTTVYTLTVQGLGGNTAASVTINVSGT